MHDVAVAVKAYDEGRKYDVLAVLVAEIARVFDVPEKLVDVIDPDRADPEIKAKVPKNSIVIIIIVVDRRYLKKLAEEVKNIYPEYSEYRDLSTREWLTSNDQTAL